MGYPYINLSRAWLEVFHIEGGGWIIQVIILVIINLGNRRFELNDPLG